MNQDINKVCLQGKIARDFMLKSTGTGKSVCSFTVITSRTYKDYTGAEKTASEYTDCVSWGKLAEEASRMHKGCVVYCEGRLQTRSWDDKESGQKKYKTEVVIDKLEKKADADWNNEADTNIDSIPFES